MHKGYYKNPQRPLLLRVLCVKLLESTFASMHYKKNLLAALLFFCTLPVMAQQATWIWYPGDYEIWLANKMQNRRTERGAFMPPFWRLDNHYALIDFHKVFELSAPEEVEIIAEGEYNVKIDSRMVHGIPRKITVPAGKHKINIKVHNQAGVPAIYVKGKNIVSDASWKVTYEDKEWIDETGKVSDQSGTTWLQAGSWNFDNPEQRPSAFSLPVIPQAAVKTIRKGNGLLVDFGKETFGFVQLHGVVGKGDLDIHYGESAEEAQATETGETLDHLEINFAQKTGVKPSLTKAFRYVYVKPQGTVSLDSVSMLYEYAPVAQRGQFRCSDAEINKIWEVANYTLQLNTREFFIDGIKRDRWIWSGDAQQSYLMNYYLFFDAPTVTRTLLALRGKDPVSSHVNTIMDYTLYWFLGVNDYYQYTGDSTFIQQFYPRMQSLMEYCLGRRNKNGMLEGLAGDWVFIDWADGLSKKGEVSFEQLLLCRSLETMARCATIAGDAAGAARYQGFAADLKQKLFAYYWNSAKGGLVHSRINGVPTSNITRYANMFAIFFDYLSTAQKASVKQRVLLNDSIQKITTPYMRFYELEALCAMGEQDYVLREMKDYWGGMLRLGATSFWEEYNPTKKGAEHYAMYGRPFGKSLCHAWGASPIYLLGKYYLGVKPTAPGYKEYLIEPALGGLQWMEGKVPTPSGDIELKVSKTDIHVQAPAGTGTLLIRSQVPPTGVAAVAKGNGQYAITLHPGIAYHIKYKG